MRFKVYDAIKEDKGEVFFRLRQDDNDVDIVVVDSFGEEVSNGWILSIKMDGSLDRAINLNKDFGLKLDSKGRIQIKGEDE